MKNVLQLLSALILSVHVGCPMEATLSPKPAYYKWISEPTLGTTEIPKTVHYVWHVWNNGNVDFPAYQQARMNKLLELHPGWQRKIWREDDCEQLLKDHYPEWLNLYMSYDKPVKKVDMIKYFILHHEGGLMLNSAFIPIKNLEPLLADADVVLGEQLDTPFHSIANGMMASVKNHPFWENIFDMLQKRKDLFILEATGPALLTDAANDYAERVGEPHKIKVLPRKYLYPFSWESVEKDAENAKRCVNSISECEEVFPESFMAYSWPGSWLEK